MLLTIMLSICAVTGASLTGCSKEKTTSSIRVMTFNLRTAAAKDSHTWVKRLPIVKELINKESPDIIGTQEGLHHQLTDLEAGLPNYKWIGVGRDRGNQGEYSAIFYNVKRMKPLQQSDFWLSSTPDVPGSKSWGNNYPRMVTWVQFEDLTNHSRFYVVNTHLDHESESARQLSAELIVQKLEKFEPNLPIFLTGDFNTNVDSMPYKTFLDAGKMKDAVQDATDRVNNKIGTFHGYKGSSSETIDWILYRGDVSLVNRSEKIAFRLDGEYPSDHYPVMIDAILMDQPVKK